MPSKSERMDTVSSVSFADGHEESSQSSESSEEDDDAETQMRPCRQRVATKFVRGDDPDETRESPSKIQFNVPTHPDLLRPSRARVPTAFARGSVCSVESCLDDDKPAAPAALDIKIEDYRTPDMPKDSDLIRKTLKSLYFFKDLDEKGCDALVDAMEVFVFDDGIEVTRQGNTTGTHFFIVLDGTFEVFRNGECTDTISKGAAFGESVILLSGAQAATVRSKDKTVVCGMNGMEVRKVFQQQYHKESQDAVKAVNDVLGSGNCHLLRKLTPYQTQCLYDQAQTRDVGAGEVLIRKGEMVEVLHVIIQGVLVRKEPGFEPQRLVPYSIVGEMVLICGEALANVEAEPEAPAKTLVLTKALLEDMFGDKLQSVMLQSKFLCALSRQDCFAAISSEQLEVAANLCMQVDLDAGQEHNQAGARFVMCLHGQVDCEVILSEKDAQPLRSCLSGTRCDAMGGGEILRQCLPWTLRARATSSSKLAVWHGKGLESVLKLGPLRRGESVVYADKMMVDTSKGIDPEQAQFYRRSPSMKIAVWQDDKVGALKKVVVLRTLSPEQLQQLAAALEIHYAMAGEIVFSQGDEGREFYIIHKGQVEIMINGQRVRTLGIGDYVGERALLFSDTRSATVKAVEDCELWKMGSKAFCEVVRGPILDYMKDRIAFQNTRIEMDGLSFMRVVGRGGFGVVKMVQAKSSGTRYALKCVSKKLAVEQRQQKALATERSILAELDHPFIIKFVRSFRTKFYVYFLMELVTGGELLDALDVLGLLTRPQARFYTASIALALEFLNERRIAYLDLKGENCLVDQHGYLKIVDFGVAERVREGRIYAVKGTPLFMAPEVILGKGYTTSADLWSLGVCLYDFMVGRFPFADENASNAEVFRAVLKKPLLFPKWFRDDSCKDLLQGLLQRDPGKRLGAGPDGYSELKEHPFFKDFSWDGLLARQLAPPFVPKSEVYAEDQEEGQGRLNENEEAQIAAEDEQADADGWVDPDPTWQEEF